MSSAGLCSEFPQGGLADLQEWRIQQSNCGKDPCLLTNSHFRFPQGSHLIRECAQELLTLLERYADQVRTRSVAWCQKPDTTNLARGQRCALPNGLMGMRIFQKVMSRELKAAFAEKKERRTGEAAVEPVVNGMAMVVLHWQVFNPVEATQHERMYSVLLGEC